VYKLHDVSFLEAGQNHNIKTGIKSLENVAEFEYKQELTSLWLYEENDKLQD
jgi:hypothetical protein